MYHLPVQISPHLKFLLQMPLDLLPRVVLVPVKSPALRPKTIFLLPQVFMRFSRKLSLRCDWTPCRKYLKPNGLHKLPPRQPRLLHLMLPQAQPAHHHHHHHHLRLQSPVPSLVPVVQLNLHHSLSSDVIVPNYQYIQTKIHNLSIFMDEMKAPIQLTPQTDSNLMQSLQVSFKELMYRVFILHQMIQLPLFQALATIQEVVTLVAPTRWHL